MLANKDYVIEKFPAAYHCHRSHSDERDLPVDFPDLQQTFPTAWIHELPMMQERFDCETTLRLQSFAPSIAREHHNPFLINLQIEGVVISRAGFLNQF